MMGQPGHTDIIIGLHKGDEQSVRALYNLYYRPLCYFSERLIHDKAEAEDIVVETFLKLLNKKNDFDRLTDVESFLFTATRNACIDFLRKIKRRQIQQLDAAQETLSITPELPGESEMITAKLLQIIYARAEGLPTQCRKVFTSFFIEGKSTAVIAAEMGISRQTVLNQKIKALQLLRLTLFKEGLHTAGIFLLILSELSRR